MAKGLKKSSAKRQKKAKSLWLADQNKGRLTKEEKLRRDIEGLRDSVRVAARYQLSDLNLSTAERRTILNHITWCITECQRLRSELAQIEEEDADDE
jgi:hypothetical protein